MEVAELAILKPREDPTIWPYFFELNPLSSDLNVKRLYTLAALIDDNDAMLERTPCPG